ncbi:MAG: tRNA (adenosine(37)-N6)-threonylcarbamoyltransferase complex dimerization subunit type 1 TsaB [Planctomycetota bacterium]
MSAAPRLAVALEISSREASVAASADRSRAIERSLATARSHASDLLVEVASAVEELGADPGDLDLVVVGTGPGSYTGLRVGAATALGLHRGSGAALVGVPTFEAIAFDALAPGERGAVIRNAFGGRVYFGAYARTDVDVEAESRPACIERGEIAERLTDDAVVIAGEDALRAVGDEPVAADRERRAERASAETLLTLGLSRFERNGDGGPESIRPLYLRPFEAKVRRR